VLDPLAEGAPEVPVRPAVPVLGDAVEPAGSLLAFVKIYDACVPDVEALLVLDAGARSMHPVNVTVSAFVGVAACVRFAPPGCAGLLVVSCAASATLAQTNATPIMLCTFFMKWSPFGAAPLQACRQTRAA
jgi:hypothetical protein